MPQRRSGFSVVEALVAITLIGVGVAAWMSTTAVAVRLAASATRSAAAHHRARTRAETLAGGACDHLVSGSEGLDTWTVTTRANSVYLIHVQSAYDAAHDPRAAVYEIMVAC